MVNIYSWLLWKVTRIKDMIGYDVYIKSMGWIWDTWYNSITKLSTFFGDIAQPILFERNSAIKPLQGDTTQHNWNWIIWNNLNVLHVMCVLGYWVYWSVTFFIWNVEGILSPLFWLVFVIYLFLYIVGIQASIVNILSWDVYLLPGLNTIKYKKT